MARSRRSAAAKSARPSCPMAPPTVRCVDTCGSGQPPAALALRAEQPLRLRSTLAVALAGRAMLGAGWRNQSINIALDRRIVCTVNGLIEQGGEEIKFVQLLKRPVLPTCKRAGIGNGATASSGVAAAATGITTAPACGQ